MKRPMRKYSPKTKMFADAKRFCLYKKLSNGETMYITSTEAMSLGHAIQIFKDAKREINFDKIYKVSGL